MPAVNEKKDNTRICKLCNKNLTIQPSSPYCASCLALKAKASRAKKKKVSEEPSRNMKGSRGDSAAVKMEEAPTKTSQEGEIVDPGRNMNSIFRGKYAYLLEEICRIAENEVRTVDEQIIYIVKNYLSNNQVTIK